MADIQEVVKVGVQVVMVLVEVVEDILAYLEELRHLL